MTTLHFTKMHGNGNDFIVIDAINQKVSLSTEQIRFLSDRHFGIGFDQLLLVEPPVQKNVDFKYRIFNADGGEVEQCGNGARCFARFVHSKNLSNKNPLHVETASGIIILTLTDDENVLVNMGPPNFNPNSLPFMLDSGDKKEDNLYTLPIDGEKIEFSAVSMGNPHITLLVDNVDNSPVHSLGARLQINPAFPQQINVGFMQIVDRHHIRLRVFERGAGETLACGTGACAAVVNGISRGFLDNGVLVDLPGGHLKIDWAGESSPVMMSGPASFVYEGQITL